MKKNFTLLEKRGLKGIVILGLVSLLVMLYFESHKNVAKAEETTAEEAKDEAGYTELDEYESTVLSELNELYYGNDSRVDIVKTDDEWLINLDFTAIEPGLADKMDESYVCSLMSKLNINKAVVNVKINNAVVESYTMNCLGEAYDKAQ